MTRIWKSVIINPYLVEARTGSQIDITISTIFIFKQHHIKLQIKLFP